ACELVKIGLLEMLLPPGNRAWPWMLVKMPYFSTTAICQTLTQRLRYLLSAETLLLEPWMYKVLKRPPLPAKIFKCSVCLPTRSVWHLKMPGFLTTLEEHWLNQKSS